MKFSSINIQGNILSSEILDKIRTEEKFKHQSPEAFGLSRSASLRDEIGHAWAIMRTHWQAYKKRLETLPQGDTGTSLTRERLIIPLLAELGYEVSRQKAQQIDGKSYAISHGAVNRSDFPIHIMGYNDNLDKRRESGGPRLSPHALVQEYLNSTEHLFALVTNGKQLRLLRDSTRLVRMSYVEFDLQRMFEEELYADFSLLFRVLHSTRMPDKIDAGPDSVIEYYHQESMASGTRIREKLSEAVEESIKTLANGFLSHRKNEELIQLIEDNHLDANTFYTHQLRLIYRVLFLIVLEERNLIYPEDSSEEQQRFRDIYYKYYSIERLRKLTENRVYVDADKFDLWESLKTTFLLFEDERYGSKIGIKPLGSGLFAYNALGNLKSQFLSNGELIKVLKHLTTFVDDQNQLVRVNYSDLDVEEFGSVYEGLLEYDPLVEKIGSLYQFSFIVGDGRSSSGSHYTPEELVKPLIKHSLDFIIADKLKEENPEKALLSITVCDVACGSGHILLSAARRIAIELASIREGAEQPSPTYYRAAIRDVIRNCIYGVDLNPLAVELCKVALWLEAHNPNEPLNFLDHHIKIGNAIVGLAHFEELQNGIANEAFKSLSGDNNVIAAEYKKRNTLERKTKQISTYDVETADLNLQGLQKEFANFSMLPENTPKEIANKSKAYEEITNDKKWYRLNNLANLQVAQFFIPKTSENKERLTTNAKYRTYLNTGAQIQDRGASNALAVEKHFFHWFLEFPQVFQNGGFDCILGNPPFKGDRRLKEAYGEEFLEWIRYKYTNGATVDLVIYFFLRINELIKEFGFQSLISSNTIIKGKAREYGLDKILGMGSSVNFAIQIMKWPGIAAVEVSLISLFKGEWNKLRYLNNKKVELINSYLEDNVEDVEPYKLYENSEISFQGSLVLGKGFVLDNHEGNSVILKNPINNKIIRPYLNGEPLLNSPNQKAHRWVIDFKSIPLRRASAEEWNSLDATEKDKHEKYGTLVNPNYKKEVAYDYPDCIQILEDRVKGERQRFKLDEKGNILIGEYQLRHPLPIKWWQFCETRPKLYKTIKNNDKVLVSCRVAYYVMNVFIEEDVVFDVTTSVIAREKFSDFTFLQSSFHEHWAWKYGSTMRFALRYTNTNCIDTFVIPILKDTNSSQLNIIGEKYHLHRSDLMVALNLGLTKVYNQFHNKDLVTNIDQLNSKAFEKKYGKETWNLYNHLEVKNEGDISYEEAVPLIFKLRELHKEMDEAVLEAYGWQDIKLSHDFYELDYLSENDRVRYTIHPEARKEVLKRILLLNHERYEQEIKKGLHKRKDVAAFYKQKGKPVPEGTVCIDDKKAKPKKKVSIVKEPQAQYGLFSEASSEIKEDSIVTLKRADNKTMKYHITKIAMKDKFTKESKQIATTSSLAQMMLGKKTGDSFEFGSFEFEILEVK
ncbi:Eco57I restriction-modification methylase domain-containing protein [Maribacter stanieri]|uniref:Eco57I restriction-modification methylase domain-containing protein n=1 Tax=Maribacter stanieri TaxID=440514 RepID=UPI00249550DA|nr:DNA methyltransferase [Maribacter stanieri]